AYEQRALSSAQVRGSHALAENRVRIDWTSSYTLSQMRQPDLRFINNFVDTIAGTPIPIIDPAEDIPPTRFNRRMSENNFDNHLNLSYNFKQWGGESATLRFGAAYLNKTREFRDSLYRYMNPNTGNARLFSDYVTPDNVWR
ncbi:hypothetical protein RZS08_38200, partial [Arthrospira platensis SPKY1]|nr:hypothetical protein [Arthrospira platensis SPKY1]